MIDESKSRRIQNLTVLVIALAVVPLAFFLLKQVFLRLTAPTPKIALAPMASILKKSSLMPILHLRLRKIGATLQATVSFQNFTDEAFTDVSLAKLKLGSIDIVSRATSLGPVTSKAILEKSFTIPTPPKLKANYIVEYDISFKTGPSAGGSLSGAQTVGVSGWK